MRRCGPSEGLIALWIDKLQEEAELPRVLRFAAWVTLPFGIVEIAKVVALRRLEVVSHHADHLVGDALLPPPAPAGHEIFEIGNQLFAADIKLVIAATREPAAF